MRQAGEAERRRSALWMAAVFAVVALLSVPALVQAKGTARPGGLDASFGNGGKLTVAFPAGNTGSTGPKYVLPFEFTPGHLEMARAPGGKVVVAGASKIVRYRADGKLDTGFGSGGTVNVPRPPGAFFVLASVAVDSAGRVVLAGVSRPLPSNLTPDPVLSSAAVMRFTADGKLDTGFGSGGMLVTDFGLNAPKAAGGPYPGASVGLVDMAIDSQDRIVLTGGEVTELLDCNRFVNSEGFVVRLTETGAVDPTFGLHRLEKIATVGQVAPRSRGYLLLASGGPLCRGEEGPDSMLIGVDEIGGIDPGFASFGSRPLAFDGAPALTIAPSGKILLLGRPQNGRLTKKDEKGEEHTIRFRYQVIQRLLPSGASDPGFSRIGKVQYVDPRFGSLSAIAVDRKERIYVVGRAGARVSKSPKNTLVRRSFLLSRLNPGGSIDRSFGRRGSVKTGFGGRSDSFATQVMLDAKDRILVGGGIATPELPSGGGFAIARYQSER